MTTTKVTIDGNTYCVETLLADRNRLKRDLLAEAELRKKYFIPKSVIEDIKAEIRKQMEDCATTSIYTRLGFDTTLHIIDKHISGKEQE